MYWEGKVRLDKDLATGLQYCCYLLCRNPRSLEMFKDRPSNDRIEIIRRKNR